MAITITKESIKELEFSDIVSWCKENNQTAWLKSLPRTTTVKIYPTVSKSIIDKNNKNRTVKVYDKTQEPIGEKTISTPYSTIKAAFVKQFFPHFITKVKEPTMWDIIDTL